MSDEIEAILDKMFPMGRSDVTRDHSRERLPKEAIKLTLEYSAKRIKELEDGLKEIIGHAHDNGSNARHMRNIARRTLEGGGDD